MNSQSVFITYSFYSSTLFDIFYLFVFLSLILVKTTIKATPITVIIAKYSGARISQAGFEVNKNINSDKNTPNRRIYATKEAPPELPAYIEAKPITHVITPTKRTRKPVIKLSD